MVPKEVPIHKYFSEPQNYNPDIYSLVFLFCTHLPLSATKVHRHYKRARTTGSSIWGLPNLDPTVPYMEVRSRTLQLQRPSSKGTRIFPVGTVGAIIITYTILGFVIILV